MWILIPKANHVISKRRYSYLCLGAWFWNVWTRTCCIYIRAAFSYIISVEKVSFSSFFSWNSIFFTIPWRGHFETWQKIDSVTGKIDPSVEQIAIRSLTWNAAHMGLMVCGLGFCGQLVILTEILMSFRGRSEVVLRSFGSREKWLNNDSWIHSNYTIWKSDPCLNSPERVGSSVFLVDMHCLGAPRINSL